ncbi:hypothetical protein EC968_003896 [Mortierella alpina]|nr:hypothetical protein EC968_003896 [Mortierella alpina]
MGADWYHFFSTTVAAIPVPKDALQQPFDLQGFKLMTISHDHYDQDLDVCSNEYHEYHGAMICLADTQLSHSVELKVIGPYQIEEEPVASKRMKHLDGFMPAYTRESLIGAFERYTGHKPDVVPGFWTVSSACKYAVKLHTTWSLGDDESIVGGHAFDGECENFSFHVSQDKVDQD